MKVFYIHMYFLNTFVNHYMYIHCTERFRLWLCIDVARTIPSMSAVCP